MTEFGSTLPPFGHVQFCATRPSECQGGTKAAALPALTKPRWNELVRVNRAVNSQVAPVTDKALYGRAEHWAYPAGKGDCEDYVLLKRRMLMDRGWPAGALLITVVRDRKGEGHAVLTVSTDKGDIILDNKTNAIRPWRQTSYRYLKRQSRTSPAKWVALSRKTAGTRIRLFGGLGN